MIGDLTPAHRGRFPEFVEKWTRIGLRTEPANCAEAERGVKLAYELAGLPPPARIVWCGSPMSMALARGITLERMSMDESEPEVSLRKVLWEEPRRRAREEVRRAVSPDVWKAGGKHVSEPVRRRVTDEVWFALCNGLRASIGLPTSIEGRPCFAVGDRVWVEVWRRAFEGAKGRQDGIAPLSIGVADRVWESVDACGYGQHDAGGLVLYDFFREVCGLDAETSVLEPSMIVTRSAGWWCPHRTTCWMSELPREIHLNVLRQLHREDGPAVVYPDGWRIHALNGIRQHNLP